MLAHVSLLCFMVKVDQMMVVAGFPICASRDVLMGGHLVFRSTVSAEFRCRLIRISKPSIKLRNCVALSGCFIVVACRGKEN